MKVGPESKAVVSTDGQFAPLIIDLRPPAKVKYEATLAVKSESVDFHSAPACAK
jgi:hypothetical protein